MTCGVNTTEIIPGHMASPARYSFQRVIRPLLKKFISQEDRRILDFGCGAGVWRFLFDEEASREIKYVGFDIVDSGFAEKKDRNVEFLLADGRFTPFRDKSFDFVFCNAVFEHIPEDCRAVSESFRVLKPGKYCCVIVPTNLTPVYDELPYLPLRLMGRHAGHGEHYYSRWHIVKLLETLGFEIECITFSLGFFGLILKTLYMYPRILRWYGTLFTNKLLNRNRYFNRYGYSGTWNAKSKAELQRICKEEGKAPSTGHRLYIKPLEFAVLLDGRIPIPLGGEWCIFAKKP